jgi:hypothetical protein
MDWEQEQRAPTRAELEREAYEEWLADTYERRYRLFCWAEGLDPEDVGSVLFYEKEWEEELDAGNSPAGE